MTEEDGQRYLTRIPILADLQRGELAELIPLVTIRSYPPYEIIFMPKEQLTSVYFLLQGRVHLSRLTGCGKKLVVTVLAPGHIFGEKSLFSDSVSCVFAEALSGCTVGILPRDHFRFFMCQYPQVVVRLAEALALRLAQLESSLVDMTFKPLSARLANILLRSAHKNGSGEEVKGFTHRDLGNMLGACRETVSATLGEFRAQGLVATSTRRITLLDRGGLEDIASH